MSSVSSQRFDRDVIRANEDDLGPMPVFLHFENHMRLDDLRIIEMQTFDFLRGVIVDRVGDLRDDGR